MDCLVILILFCLAVIVNLWAEAGNIDILRYYSKPLLMPMLAFYYWITAPDTDIFVLLALWLSFAGDVMLLFPGRKTFFMLGLASFLACQLCYIRYFVHADAFPAGIHPAFWILLLVYIAAGVMIYINLRKNLEDMKIPVIIYMTVILSLGFICAARCFAFHGTAFWLPFSGSILFILSDTLLAFNRFKKPLKFDGMFVMATYIAAQLLLVLGIIAE